MLTIAIRMRKPDAEELRAFETMNWRQLYAVGVGWVCSLTLDGKPARSLCSMNSLTERLDAPVDPCPIYQVHELPLR